MAGCGARQRRTRNQQLSLLAGGSSIVHTVAAGLPTVGSTDEQDAKLGLDGRHLPGAEPDLPKSPDDQPAAARMLRTAHFAKTGRAAARPIVFI